MLCEYCRQTLPDNELSCPHCGAANPNYKGSDSELKEKVVSLQKEVNYLKSKQSPSITINNYTNVSVPKQKSPQVKAANSKRQVNSDTTDKNYKLSFKCSAVIAFFVTCVFLVTTDVDLPFLLFYLIFYFASAFANGVLFEILDIIKANKVIKLIFCAALAVLSCITLKKFGLGMMILMVFFAVIITGFVLGIISLISKLTSKR